MEFVRLSSPPSCGYQAQNFSLEPSDTLIWINGTAVATSTGIGKCHDHRAKDGQEHVSDRIGHRNPEHGRLTVRSLAGSGDRRIHCHRSREGATNDDRVQAQDAIATMVATVSGTSVTTRPKERSSRPWD